MDENEVVLEKVMDETEVVPNTFAPITPEVAHSNIEGAKYFNINADVFAERKDSFAPYLEPIKSEPKMTPIVQEYASESEQQKALIQKDINSLSNTEKMVKFASDQIFGRRQITDHISDIGFDMVFNSDKVTPDTVNRLSLLNAQSEQYNVDYGLTNLERFPGVLGGMVSALVAPVWKHKEIIAAATGVGATLGSIGTPIGTVGGAIAGFAPAASGAIGFEMFKSQVGTIYNELSKPIVDYSSPNVPPRVIDETTKKFYAAGIGVVSTAIAVGTGALVGKTMPFVGKFIGAKAAAKIVSDPTMAAVAKTMMNIGKATLSGSGGAGAFSTVDVFGTAFAKAYDGETEGSFVNALSVAAEAVTAASTDIITASAAGGALGLAASATAGVVGFKTTREGFKTKMDAASSRAFNESRDVTPTPPKQLSDIAPIIDPKTNSPVTPTPSDRAVSILHLDSLFDAVTKEGETTSISKISPNEQANIYRRFLERSGIREIYLPSDQLARWASKDPKHQKALNILDPSGETAKALNDKIKVRAHEFVPFYIQYPELADMYSMTPEGPNVQQAIDFLKEQSVQQQNKVLKTLKVEDMTPEQREAHDAKLKELVEPTNKTNDIFGEDDYLDQTELRKAAEVFMPPGELEPFLAADMEAKQMVVDNINETATHEMNQIVDIVTEQAIDTEREIQLQRLENNPNLAVVDQFTNGYETRFRPESRYQTYNDLTEAHHKKGFSPFAIDPGLLSEELKFLVDNEQLIKHKVFVKGGLSPDASARLLGVSSGDDLLRILVHTPTRDEVVTSRVKAREADIAAKARESVDLNQVAIAKSYDAVLDNAVKTFNHMKSYKWPAQRNAIKRIALIPPSIPELTQEAREIVSKIKLKDLNPTRFKVGMRRSNKLATTNVLKGFPEEAMIAQKTLALNTALVKESLLKVAAVNRATKFVKTLRDKEVIQEIKDAGPLTIAAFDEILDVFNLDASKKGKSEKDAFKKWANKKFKNGEGDFHLPDTIADIKKEFGDMTVEQYLSVTGILRSMLADTRKANKLYRKDMLIHEAKTLERLERDVNDYLSSHWDYNLNRTLVKRSGDNPLVTKAKDVGRWFLKLKSLFEKTKFVVSKMDEGKSTGLMNDLILQPLKDASVVFTDSSIQVRDQLEKIIIGSMFPGEWDRMANTVVNAPELSGIDVFNGKIALSDLFMLELNTGNEGNWKAVDRYGLPREVWTELLEKHFDHQHFITAQRILDIWSSFKPRITELGKRVGIEYTFTEPVPKMRKGRIYPGGHFPIMTVEDRVGNAAERVSGTLNINRDRFLRSKYFAERTTDQGYLKARTGDVALLDLDTHRLAHSFDQTLHDLAYREATRDVVKVLTNESIRRDMEAVIGEEGQLQLIEMVEDVIDAVDITGYNSLDRGLRVASEYFAKGVAINQLGLKLSTVLIQPVSLVLMVERMGPSGMKHLAKTVGMFTAHPNLIGHFWRFAQDVHPSIQNIREDMESRAAHSIEKLMPKKSMGAPIDILALAHQLAYDTSYKVLGEADHLVKVIGINTLFSQAIEGDVEGIKVGDFEAAIKYASNEAEMSLTHSDLRLQAPIQKKWFIKGAAMYWNDPGNVANEALAIVRRARKAAHEAGEEFKEGEYLKGFKTGRDGALAFMGSLLAYAFMQDLEDWLHGRKGTILGNPQLFDSPLKTTEAVKDFAFGQPLQTVVGTVPWLRDINFSIVAKKWQKHKTVEMPKDSIVNDFATSVTAVLNYVETGHLGYGKKELVRTSGTFLHLPVQGALQIINYVSRKGSTAATDTSGIVDKTVSAIDSFTNDKKVQADVDPEFLNALKNYKSQIRPETYKPDVPQHSLDVIKQIESKGDWRANNPASSAIGLYQFTKETWSGIKKEAPELGLTDNGRLAKDPEQQEKAMRWLTDKTMRAFKNTNIEPTTENLYAAHFLGLNTALSIFTSKASDKIKPLVGEEVLKSNGFSGSMKVKDFKKWLADKVKEAETQLTTSPNK